MAEEIKDLLKQQLEILKDNNKKLKRLNRKETMRTISTTIRWTIIIALVIGGYYAAKPFVDQSKEAFNTFQEGVETIKDAPENVKDSIINIVPGV